MIHSPGEVVVILREGKSLNGPKQQIGTQKLGKKGKILFRQKKQYIKREKNNRNGQISLAKSRHQMALENDVGKRRDEENVQNTEWKEAWKDWGEP